MVDIYRVFNSSIAWFSEQKDLNCSLNIRSWLIDPKSLTTKLESCAQTFEVRVKDQELTKPSIDLSGYFANRKKLLIRNVFLYVDHKAVIFAQTEIPISTLNAQSQSLSNIGPLSLGSILFKHAAMSRGDFEFAEFKQPSTAHQLAQTIDQPSDYSLWARRSMFYLNGYPLLVSELFLPASGIYQ